MGKLFSALFEAIYLAYMGITGKVDASKQENLDAVANVATQVTESKTALGAQLGQFSQSQADGQKEVLAKFGEVSQSIGVLNIAVGESQKVMLESVVTNLSAVAERIEKSNQAYLDRLSEIFNLDEGFKAAEQYRIS